MYEMFTGLPPFYSEDVQLMYSKIMNAKLKFPSNIPNEAANLIEGVRVSFSTLQQVSNLSSFPQLLTRDPAKRLADPAAIKVLQVLKRLRDLY